MRNIKIYTIVVFLFFSGLTLARPQKVNTPDTVAIQTDTTRVSALEFPEEKITEFKTDGDFNYGQSPKLKMNLWQKFLQWLLGLFGDFVKIQGSDMWLKILFYSAIGGIILYAILKLAKADIRKAFYNLSDRGNLEFSVTDEDIHQMDFEALIEEAIAKKEYKKAVRLYYLFALKKLADRDLIHWKPGKTNHEYEQELDSQEIRPSFGDLSYYFDYAWYGDFPVDQNLFDRVKTIFRDFKAIIDKKKTTR